MEMVLRDVEGKLEKEIDVAKLRRDQILMYALLGDPATQLRLPDRLEARVERKAAGWHWRAKRPTGAARLDVGFRTAQPLLPRFRTRRSDQDQAAAVAEAANAYFTFVPQPSPPDAGPWEGTCADSGWLRLVAIGKGRLYTAVFKLEKQ